MEKRIYSVVNDKGEVAGHDMDIITAQQCLDCMSQESPEENWEIIYPDF